MKPLSSIPKLGRDFWRTFINYAVRAIREETAAGRDVDGKSFDDYTRSYAERKSEGKAAGKGAKSTRGRGAGRESAATGYLAQASRSTKPDLTLTGKMMQDLQAVKANDYGGELGWPAQGAKVEWNEDSGRAVTTDDQPLSKAVLAQLERDMGIEIDRNIKEAAGDLRLKIRIA